MNSGIGRALVLVCAFVCVIPSAHASSITWLHEFGTPSFDEVRGVATTDTAVYAAGYTSGALPGQTQQGDEDGFVRKWGLGGKILWTRQFGVPGYTIASSIAVSPAGDLIVVAGRTGGALGPEGQAGGGDPFIRAYGPNGGVRWTHQIGSPQLDEIFAVSMGSAGIFAVGSTNGVLPGASGIGGPDAFLQRYTRGGELLWTRQFGTPQEDVADGVSADAQGVYVAGGTRGAFAGQQNAGNYDMFVRRVGLQGGARWTYEYGGGGRDIGGELSSDPNGVYAVGAPGGRLPGTSQNGSASILKLDPKGTPVWLRQFGTGVFANAVSDDGALVSLGMSDGKIRTYSTHGTLGSTADLGADIEGLVRHDGVIYCGGTAGHSIDGQTYRGVLDAFAAEVT